MHLPVTISIPYLWGDKEFQKDEWGAINFIVGPNGTGKSLFAEQLKEISEKFGLSTRYLNAERLYGLEKSVGSDVLQEGVFSNYSNYPGIMTSSHIHIPPEKEENFGFSLDSFMILRRKIDIKIKIEARLSQLFGKTIRLAEIRGDFVPQMKNIHDPHEYGLKTGESHGIKETVSLLTFLYDDDCDCMIIDEPEMHLHPQLQSLILQEIRQVAGDPLTESGKKCFFLITHSPYIVDIRTPEDLKHCIVFQPGKLPTYIKQYDNDDEWKIKRLLPRLNTHHKQFFFASRPIFVEGYTDQQLFSLIQERRMKLLGSPGSCIVDVGGKDELDLFFRLCKILNIEAQFICDLDSLFSGKLRQSVSRDERCIKYVQENGQAKDLMKFIGRMENLINNCLAETKSKLEKTETDNTNLQTLSKMLSLQKEPEKERYIYLIGLLRIQTEIAGLTPDKNDDINYILGMHEKIVEAFEQCNVYLLKKGELENYLRSYEGNQYDVSDDSKRDVFEKERDFLLDNVLSETEIRRRYDELIDILDKSSHSSILDIDSHINPVIGEWIYLVQLAFHRREIIDRESLSKAPQLKWSAYSRLFDLVEFTPNKSGFSCIIKLKASIDPSERVVKFNENTIASSFTLSQD